MLDWLAANKEWIFSGIGVSAITLVGLILRRNRKTPNDNATQEHFVVQTPSITQSPSINITNQIPPFEPAKAEFPILQRNQPPIFALNPLVAMRDVSFIDSSVSADGMAEVCIARFRLHDGMQGSIEERFEASIDYVENLSASGMPYQDRTGHVNQGQWLPAIGDVQELLLTVDKSHVLYTVNSVESSRQSNRDPFVRLDVRSSGPLATVTLTDLTNGRKWTVVFRIGYDNAGRTTVRETQGLH